MPKTKDLASLTIDELNQMLLDGAFNEPDVTPDELSLTKEMDDGTSDEDLDLTEEPEAETPNAVPDDDDDGMPDREMPEEEPDGEAPEEDAPQEEEEIDEGDFVEEVEDPKAAREKQRWEEYYKQRRLDEERYYREREEAELQRREDELRTESEQRGEELRMQNENARPSYGADGYRGTASQMGVSDTGIVNTTASAGESGIVETGRPADNGYAKNVPGQNREYGYRPTNKQEAAHEVHGYRIKNGQVVETKARTEKADGVRQKENGLRNGKETIRTRDGRAARGRRSDITLGRYTKKGGKKNAQSESAQTRNNTRFRIERQGITPSGRISTHASGILSKLRESRDSGFYTKNGVAPGTAGRSVSGITAAGVIRKQGGHAAVSEKNVPGYKGGYTPGSKTDHDAQPASGRIRTSASTILGRLRARTDSTVRSDRIRTGSGSEGRIRPGTNDTGHIRTKGAPFASEKSSGTSGIVAAGVVRNGRNTSQFAPDKNVPVNPQPYGKAKAGSRTDSVKASGHIRIRGGSDADIGHIRIPGGTSRQNLRIRTGAENTGSIRVRRNTAPELKSGRMRVSSSGTAGASSKMTQRLSGYNGKPAGSEKEYAPFRNDRKKKAAKVAGYELLREMAQNRKDRTGSTGNDSRSGQYLRTDMRGKVARVKDGKIRIEKADASSRGNTASARGNSPLASNGKPGSEAQQPGILANGRGMGPGVIVRSKTGPSATASGRPGLDLTNTRLRVGGIKESRFVVKDSHLPKAVSTRQPEAKNESSANGVNNTDVPRVNTRQMQDRGSARSTNTPSTAHSSRIRASHPSGTGKAVAGGRGAASAAAKGAAGKAGITMRGMTTVSTIKGMHGAGGAAGTAASGAATAGSGSTAATAVAAAASSAVTAITSVLTTAATSSFTAIIAVIAIVSAVLGVASTTPVQGGTGVALMGNEATVYYYLSQKGLNDVLIAGILGNLKAESSVNPSCIQGGRDDPYDYTPGHAIGMIQWDGGRHKKLVEYTQSIGTEWNDINAQLDFLWGEFDRQAAQENPYTTYQWIRSDYSYDAFMSCSTPEDAAYVFARGFERCASTTCLNRKEYAREYLEKIQSGAIFMFGNDFVGWMEMCAVDDHVGYCQLRRTSIYTRGYIGGNIVDCDCDCSSFVFYALNVAGYMNKIGSYPWNTDSMKAGLQNLGFVRVEASGATLMRGDVLVTYGRGHTKVYGGNGYFVEASGHHGPGANHEGESGDTSGDHNGEEVAINAGSSTDGYYVYRYMGTPA